MSRTAVLIGHGPLLVACAEVFLRRGGRIVTVVSDCPQVADFAQKNGVKRLDTSEDVAAALAAESFDYLFSIVNHAITPEALLRMPKLRAVNYHDSPLPAYSGFNATTWAILDGRTEHGITWHEMTGSVDGGGVLLSERFPVAEDDTAFSVAARAGEVMVRTFGELLDALDRGVTAAPPLPAENFHFKSDRPSLALITPDASVVSAERLVRALDFGPEESWLTRAKLWTPSRDFVVVGSITRLGGSEGSAPGTIRRASALGIELALADGVVRLGDLTSLEGAEISEAELSKYGLVDGAVLGRPEAELFASAAEVDARVTKTERYWVSRLGRISAPTLSEYRAHLATGVTDRVAADVPSSVSGLTEGEQQKLLVGALGIYLRRVGEEVSEVSLGLSASGLPRALTGLYASVVPLLVDLGGDVSIAEVTRRVDAEFSAATKRLSYARDVWTRYPRLRGQSEERSLRVVVLSSDAPELTTGQLPAGAHLAFVPRGASVELLFDAGAVSRVGAERVLSRLVGLVQKLAERSASDESSLLLPVVTPEEQSTLLTVFQDTFRPSVDVRPIHELFSDQVARTPSKTAVTFRGKSVTYAELDRRANALAAELVRCGVGPDQLVAISVERSIEMLVSLLGVLKAGGAYVPLDPAYPEERLAIMLEDSGARLLVTQRHLEKRLPRHSATCVFVDDERQPEDKAPDTITRPENLAYVIFTSGSTGRPKGVMVEHRNAANFFAGMDERVGTEPGVWLAVTSISFDISVLELFWTLTRGFEVVIQEEGDRASLLKSQSRTRASSKPMGFGLFYFAADSSNSAQGNAYRLLLEGARFADDHDFVAVWTPERHFHAFGGLYPNPAVTSAAIAAITKRVELRAGSVVIPLHDPIRVAEEWAVVDNLSGGRVGLSFASGWHANDFALRPENYERRREVMQESIDTVLKLWAGEKIKVKNGLGAEIEVSVLPRPMRERPPMWVASAGNVDTFKLAGKNGYNVLTNMLGQDIRDLGTKFAAYREARREAGHEGDGIISVMLHTFVTSDDDKAKELARRPFGNYLKASYDLVKVAPWMFPAFKQPSLKDQEGQGGPSAFDPSRFDDGDMEALLDHAFERYFDTAGLFGTPERALAMVEQLKEIGATEVACLVDFGIEPDVVLENLAYLDELRRLANPGEAATELTKEAPLTIREQFEARSITHFQCTPSMARMLVADGTLEQMTSLRRFLVGGEALPTDLAEKIKATLPHTKLVNMYGPTETTVWSTTAEVVPGEAITIGTPIANTQIRILDERLGLLPIGTPGELLIGGQGVVRGYLGRADLTAERFVPDPYLENGRLYRTGDLARFRPDGRLEYIGRIDHQVKVNGYRIELGEIETVLGRHPAVKEAVVAVKEGAVGPELVGYVVPVGESKSGPAGAEDVGHWKKRWDEAYSKRVGAADAPVRFDTSGWLDSFDGAPIEPGKMREWLDATLARILALKPKRVLEIGCGTGMILYGCLEHVEHYTAVDLSPHALETIRKELSLEERAKVTLLNQAAHELAGISDESFDLVIINSVAQYFPSAEYLEGVLTRVAKAIRPGGHVFLGDVRSLEEAQSFHARVELEKSPSGAECAALRTRIRERAELDTELLLGQGFFARLEKNGARLFTESIQLKPGGQRTEMRDYRSDVVLGVGEAPRSVDPGTLRVVDGSAPGFSLEAALVEPSVAASPLVLVQGISNQRLSAMAEALATIERGDAGVTAADLRDGLERVSAGLDPAELFGLSDYVAEVRFGRVPGTFDALLRRRGAPEAGRWAPNPDAPIASVPHAAKDEEGLAAKLRTHLRDFLPEYMVPTAFVTLAAFPLTPNGKIDRKVLPKPSDKPRQAAAEYVIPSNELEQKIAEIWRDMLGLERVGRKDNIFDLGASSLLTVEANNRLQTLLGKKIPLVTMFRYPTIEALATHLAKSGETSGSTATPAVDEAELARQARLADAAERRRRARAQLS